jgi:hypothetical protein
MSGANAMSPRAKRVITGLLLAFILAHVASLVLQRLHWPLIHYPMFSFRFDEPIRCSVLYGVPEDPAKPEFRVMPPQIGLHPITLCRVFSTMMKFPQRSPYYDQLAAECGPGSEEATRACVSDRLARRVMPKLLARYERIRKSNAKLPALRAFRIYDVTYQPVPPPKLYDDSAKQLRVEWQPEVRP